MSLLLEHGHTEAQAYPIGMVFDEANFVLERTNSRIITDAQLKQLAATSVLSKGSRSKFGKMIKSLNISVKPLRGLFD